MNMHDANNVSVLPTRPLHRDIQQVRRGANTLLDRIPGLERSGLAAKMEPRKLAQGEILFIPGVMNTHVYFPEDAVISHIYESEAGTSVEAALIGPEGASGLCPVFDGQPPEHRASVTVGGYAACIRLSDLKIEMSVDPVLQSRLVSYLAGHVAEVGRRVSCSVFHLAEERLCTWLLLLKDRSGKTDIRITHDEISSLLGLNRTSVSCIAKRLKDNGSVDYARGKFRICDPSLLMASACECYSILSRPKQTASAVSLL